MFTKPVEILWTDIEEKIGEPEDGQSSTKEPEEHEIPAP